jgi:hypothetical protein
VEVLERIDLADVDAVFTDADGRTLDVTDDGRFVVAEDGTVWGFAAERGAQDLGVLELRYDNEDCLGDSLALMRGLQKIEPGHAWRIADPDEALDGTYVALRADAPEAVTPDQCWQLIDGACHAEATLDCWYPGHPYPSGFRILEDEEQDVARAPIWVEFP